MLSFQSPQNQPIIIGSGIYPQGQSRTDAGPLSLEYLNKKLGLKSAHLSSIIAQRHGQSTQDIQELFDLVGPTSRIKGSRSPLVQYLVGKDFNALGRVVSTTTPNGVGLDRLRIVVNGPQSTNTPWYSTGQIVIGRGNRHFLVNDYTMVATGQELDLIPLDGVGNLRVVGGQSVEFPNELEIGDIGVSVNPACDVRSNQRRQDADSYENVITILKEETVRQRHVAHRGFVFDINIKTVDGDTLTVQGIMQQEEYDAYKRLRDNMAASLIFGKRNFNPQAGNYIGNGLLQQVDNRLQVPLDFKEVKEKPFLYLNELLRQWDMLYPNQVHKNVVCAVGSHAWYDLQRGLTYTSNTHQQFYDNRRDALKSMSEAEQKLYQGVMFDGMATWSGHNILLKRIKAFDQAQYTSDRDLVDGENSIHSHDILLLDMGKKMNPNYVDGKLQEEDDYKINMYCLQNPDGSKQELANVYQTGLIDEQANMIASGEVLSFSGESRRYMEMNMALCVEDPSAVMHISATY
jgi:hypothetical protein